MKILLCSVPFPPGIGGIEIASRIFAEEFVRAGHSVTVVTDSLDPEGTAEFAYPVVRRPSRKQLLELGKQADIIFQNNISTKTLLPLLPLRKPIVVTTQTWVARNNGTLGWQDRLKLALLRFVNNVAISKAIADKLPKKSTIIGNPFDAALFTPYRDVPKTKDIVFLGRLVSDKGCDLALQALATLKAEGLTPTFTIIGDGSERVTLEVMAENLGISQQVEFLGNLGANRASAIAEHKVMVVPSRWAEPFGIVALEGIATGCALVASSGGGLPDAVGPCGLLFPNGDAAALATALKKVLIDDASRNQLTAAGPAHLENFTPVHVAKRYLDLFQQLIQGNSRNLPL